MDIKYSRSAGIILAITTIAVIAFVSTNSVVDSVATVNGVEIDQSTFDFYLQNRVQTPLAQVTTEEREVVLQELKDIYILSTQPRASELAEDPKIKAQIELQYRAAMAQAVATDWLESNPASEVLQIGQGDLLAPRDIGQRDGALVCVQGQVEQGGDGVASLGSQTHGRLFRRIG